MSHPTDRRYTTDHEWVAVENDVATVGITSYAAEALGDVVYVELPEVGRTLSAGEACGEIESTKSVSDLVAPADGEVLGHNEAAVASPEGIGADPYGAGWLYRMRLAGEPAGLLDAAGYTALVEGQDA
ncbi:glycine cleavage system protein GcvH [Georgenia sp. TF02-10]|uniref:glycine cleavage system protein GcvH n=1 Tax=Georgenia sp. TF02-10 TaxID=2917725 RepID=UPI001FA6D096|nr:glycine cleavage system protein GcvH [Georgenia sp. TF02-10]UNX53397.1 glycine cleavage system protein GcvH [Georgenia sp. TF02-10]